MFTASLSLSLSLVDDWMACIEAELMHIVCSSANDFAECNKRCQKWPKCLNRFLSASAWSSLNTVITSVETTAC